MRLIHSGGLAACALLIGASAALAQGQSPRPANAKAVCKDGTYSTSTVRSGACSTHGGVKQWLDSTATRTHRPGTFADTTDDTVGVRRHHRMRGDTTRPMSDSAGMRHQPRYHRGDSTRSRGDTTNMRRSRYDRTDTTRVRPDSNDMRRSRYPRTDTTMPAPSDTNMPPTRFPRTDTGFRGNDSMPQPSWPRDSTDTMSLRASARCSDGSYSHSHHRGGTCSQHGGVGQWLMSPDSAGMRRDTGAVKPDTTHH